ncbi:hypothetical protein MKZ20_17930 [Psychrobacillus sp. FSL K6-2684]|uniref:hypothetical protein n=2 Tax=unclassified Psychrobacillus TaxID=2636677 RepID=UPI0030F9394C
MYVDVDTKGTEKVVKEYDVISYRPANGKHGLENHHGVMNEWAKQNIPGYKEKVGKSPTVALTDRNNGGMHEATKKVYRKWLRERTGRPVGAKVDWKMLVLKRYKNYQKICLMLQRFRN